MAPSLGLPLGASGCLPVWGELGGARNLALSIHPLGVGASLSSWSWHGEFPHLTGVCVSSELVPEGGPGGDVEDRRWEAVLESYNGQVVQDPPPRRAWSSPWYTSAQNKPEE